MEKNKKNVILPSLRLDTETKQEMDLCISALNQNKEGVEINLETFRRMSYRHLINKITSEKGLNLLLKFAH